MVFFSLTAGSGRCAESQMPFGSVFIRLRIVGIGRMDADKVAANTGDQ